jgi:hypothetical protein
MKQQYRVFFISIILFCLSTYKLFSLCSNANFAIHNNISMNGNIRGIFVGDFNNDGIQDIASGNNNNTISIRLGMGNGNFTGNTFVNAGGLCVDFAIGDFNGDGMKDLISANASYGTVSVLLGDNLGGFTLNNTVTVGAGYLGSIVVGDFNSDGKQDFVTANSNSNYVALRLGNGLGGFSGNTNVTVGLNPNSVATGDFNGDGKLDLVTANGGSNTASVLLGNGTGTFGSATSITVETLPQSVAVGHFNADGFQDIVVTNYISNTVSVRLGNGSGGFNGSTNVGVLQSPISIAIGDFNGDGLQDFATSALANSVSIRLGNGQGGFTSGPNANTGAQHHFIKVGDFNNDGKQDIITALSSLSTVVVLLGGDNEINLEGNGINIPDGSTTISSSINTDFGTVSLCNSSTKTFVILNNGAASILLSINNITITGVNAGDFFVSVFSPTSITSPGSLGFTISFSPTATGVRTATVHVNNTDCDEGDYDFLVQGTGDGVSPVLGNYPASSVTAGSNITVLPDSAPIGVSTLNVSATAGFTGVLIADPSTGAVRITNAKPAGTYTIKIAIGFCAIKTFTLTVTNPNCSHINFNLNSTVSMNSSVFEVVVGDFNNDGIQDIASANNNSTISVRLGTGTGTFAGSTNINALGNCVEFAIGDFNMDGKQDFVTANSGSGTFSVLLGDGLGGFVFNSFVNTGGQPNSIKAGDFNNDGKPDFVLSNQTLNSVSIRLGNGLGGFSESVNVSLGVSPSDLSIGDFNNDGNLDVVTANSGSGTVSILLGNGTGGLNNATSISVGSSPTSVSVGYLNADGIQDLAVANSNSHTVSIRLGNGSGGFTGTTDISVNTAPSSVAVGDFNGDGFQDFVATSVVTNNASIRLGDGLGGFVVGSNVNVGSISQLVSIGDFNSDGRQDLVTASSGSNNVSVLLGVDNEINLQANSNTIVDGSTTISSTINTDFGTVSLCNTTTKLFTIQNTGSGSVSLSINSITVTGVNAVEFVVSAITPVTLNTGGTFSFTISFSPTAYGVRSATVHVNNTDCDEGDYDFLVQGIGDGVSPVLGNYPASSVTAGSNITVLPDSAPIGVSTLNVSATAGFTGVLIADPSTGAVRITNAKPAGTYTIKIAIGFCAIKTFTLTVTNGTCSHGNVASNNQLASNGNPISVVIGDFNNDSIQDIATAVTNGNISVRLGTGAGNFTSGSTFGTAVGCMALAVGDFNSDGNQDLVTANDASNSVSVMFGNGLGTSTFTVNVFVNGRPFSIATGDFNNDHKLDFVTSNQFSNSVTICLGNGLGNFNYGAIVNVGILPLSLSTGDFNSDGNLDIATANFGSNIVSILLGNGSGGLGTPTNVSAGNSPRSIAVGDFNADGKQDIAVANSSTNTVSIRLGNGSGSFTGSTSVSVSSSPFSVAIGDLNADGFLDFTTANSVSNDVSIRLGNGLGSFSTVPGVSVGITPYSVVIGDFNSDGRQDLVVANGASLFTSVLLGTDNEINLQANGNNIPDGNTSISSSNNTDFGTISMCTSTSKTYTIQNTGSDSLSISSITITGANAGEFVVSGFSSASIGSGGSTNFSITFRSTAPGVRNATVHINNTDCNESDYDFTVQGNGDVNLPQLGNYPATSVTVSSNITVAPGIAPTGTNSLNVSAPATFSGILTIEPATGIVSITNAKPAGTYTISITSDTCILQTFTLTVIKGSCSHGFLNLNNNVPVNGNISSVVITDFNNDGIQDFASASTSHISFRLGTGSGNFTGSNYISEGVSYSAVAVGDFNRDGNQDLATANGVSGVSILLGDGLGSFSISNVNIGVFPNNIAVGDFNSDGKQDLVTSNNSTNTISIRLGNGFGSFSGSSNFNVGTSPVSVATGDFNGDGKLDVVTANLTNTASILLGNGLGSLGSATNISVGAAPRSVAVGDFNADGFQDFAVANSNSNTVTIRLGNGSGGFTSVANVGVNTTPYSIATGDFNSDGFLDLATANNGSNDVTTRLGNGLGSFPSSYNVNAGSSPRSVAVGDFNGDGRQDLAAGNTSNVSVLLGVDYEINLQANGNNISDGSTTISTILNTDFGTQSLCNPITKTFIIQNTGSGLFSLPAYSITITGTNASDFVVSAFSPASIVPGGSAAFTITFSPTGTGIRTATVHVNNNDCDEGDYDFVIQGTGGLTPVLLGNYQTTYVTLNGNVMAIPDTLPSGTMTLSASSSAGFTGLLSADPVTGNIQITNAGPIGTYTITVAVGTCVSKSFTLNVVNGPCISPSFTSCPTIQNIIAPAGLCHLPVSYFASTSGLPTPILTYSFTGATNSSGNGTGSELDFNSGMTQVIVTSNNMCGSTTCSFDVNVNTNIDDNNSCTVDGCDPANPFHIPVNLDDGNACTLDGCEPINGVYHVTISAFDGNACTNDLCDPLTGIYHTPFNTSDNNLCTTDICDPTIGIFHIPVNTNDNNVCTIDGCDPVSGVYHNPATEICDNSIDDNCNGHIDEGCVVTLFIQLFIEGFYIGNGTMKAVADPINYSSVCDTVIIELHEKDYPHNVICYSSNIIDIYGYGEFAFPNYTLYNSYYLAVRHRNALETWSSRPITFNSQLEIYLFTDSVSKAYGNNTKNLGDGNFALWSGDISDAATATLGLQDGIIESQDYSDLENAVYFILSGYNPQDLTGDDLVESEDYSLIENNIFNFIFSMHP